MQRLLVVILVSFSFGCAMTLVDSRVGDDTVRVAKISLMRKGPYNAVVTVPTEKGKAKVDISGNDEAMSGNLAMTGATIGAVVAGPGGAAAGGVVGTFADWVKEKVGVDKLETISPDTNLFTPPDLPKVTE